MAKKSRQTLRAERENEKERQEILQRHPEWQDEAKIEDALKKFANFKRTPKAKTTRSAPCPPRLTEILDLLTWFEPFKKSVQVFGALLPDDWFDQVRKAIGSQASNMTKNEMLRYLEGELAVWKLVLNRLVPWKQFGAIKLRLPTSEVVPAELVTCYRISIDDEGKAHFTAHEAIDILEGIETHRIKRCRNCGNLFWAGRIDKPTCSIRCGNTWRQQRWRAGYDKNYKKKRIDKANLKEGKKGGNK